MGQQLNSLAICLSHSWGGLEQVAACDALDLADAGFNVGFLCLADTPIHRHVVGHPALKVIALDSAPRNYLDLKLRAELLHWIRGGVNLIHTHQTTLLGSIVPWLWKERSVGLLATRHIMNNHNKKDFIHRALYGRVDALVVVSQAVRSNILATHAIHEKKVKVIHLGLDFDQFDPKRVRSDYLRRAWGVDSDTVLVGLVGRIDPAKGQATFIKAAAGLMHLQDSKLRLKFVIVGEETRGAEIVHLNELKEMVKQFRLEDSVLFVGFQDNIPEVMSALDIVVMPSRQEAFGLVAIEAMAMKCPVVISRGGSAKEIVGNDEYGLVVRPDDAFDLQRQLRFLLENPQKRIEMGNKARTYVRENFDRKKRLINTVGLYGRVLKRRRAVG